MGEKLTGSRVRQRILVPQLEVTVWGRMEGLQTMSNQEV